MEKILPKKFQVRKCVLVLMFFCGMSLFIGNMSYMHIKINIYWS
jgi:hypothetical protein